MLKSFIYFLGVCSFVHATTNNIPNGPSYVSQSDTLNASMLQYNAQQPTASLNTSTSPYTAQPPASTYTAQNTYKLDKEIPTYTFATRKSDKEIAAHKFATRKSDKEIPTYTFATRKSDKEIPTYTFATRKCRVIDDYLQRKLEQEIATHTFATYLYRDLDGNVEPFIHKSLSGDINIDKNLYLCIKDVTGPGW